MLKVSELTKWSLRGVNNSDKLYIFSLILIFKAFFVKICPFFNSRMLLIKFVYSSLSDIEISMTSYFSLVLLMFSRIWVASFSPAAEPTKDFDRKGG